MATSSWLATWMDWDFLTKHSAIIHPESVAANDLPYRNGPDVSRELGGRKLLRYITPAQIGTFANGSTEPCYVTPTPYAPDEAARWLVLPSPQIVRRHVLILDPARIDLIQGPQWVAMGRGIQYILPRGFRADAITVPGAPGAHWEIEIN